MSSRCQLVVTQYWNLPTRWIIYLKLKCQVQKMAYTDDIIYFVQTCRINVLENYTKSSLTNLNAGNRSDELFAPFMKDKFIKFLLLLNI